VCYHDPSFSLRRVRAARGGRSACSRPCLLVLCPSRRPPSTPRERVVHYVFPNRKTWSRHCLHAKPPLAVAGVCGLMISDFDLLPRTLGPFFSERSCHVRSVVPSLNACCGWGYVGRPNPWAESFWVVLYRRWLFYGYRQQARAAHPVPRSGNGFPSPVEHKVECNSLCPQLRVRAYSSHIVACLIGADRHIDSPPDFFGAVVADCAVYMCFVERSLHLPSKKNASRLSKLQTFQLKKQARRVVIASKSSCVLCLTGHIPERDSCR